MVTPIVTVGYPLTLRSSKPSVFLRIMAFDIYTNICSAPPTRTYLETNASGLNVIQLSSLNCISDNQLRPSNSCACIASNGGRLEPEDSTGPYWILWNFDWDSQLPFGFIWIHISKFSKFSWLFCFETSWSHNYSIRITSKVWPDEMGLLHWRNSQGWKRHAWTNLSKLGSNSCMIFSQNSF